MSEVKNYAEKIILKTVIIITKILGMIFLINGLIFYVHITLINKQLEEVLKKKDVVLFLFYREKW